MHRYRNPGPAGVADQGPRFHDTFVAQGPAHRAAIAGGPAARIDVPAAPVKPIAQITIVDAVGGQQRALFVVDGNKIGQFVEITHASLGVAGNLTDEG